MQTKTLNQQELQEQASNLTDYQWAQLGKLLTPKMTKFIPHEPYSKQQAFLLLDCLEAFYGGAAGGGKSDALLMAALQYVDVPGYSAILFRQSYTDLTLPGALMDRAKEWLSPWEKKGEVRWVDKLKTYFFKCPGGGEASLSFGYLEHDSHKYRYQGAEFQFVGFDEVTQILESCYRYLFSRLRRLKGVDIPLRARCASNPGGAGHFWVKNRFITGGRAEGRIFIPSSLEDNPFLDEEAYDRSLQELDPVTRAQLRQGNWEIANKGPYFDRTDFEVISRGELPERMRLVRFWDQAATEKKITKKNKLSDPDWTVGLKIGLHNGIYYVLDIRRFRKDPGNVEEVIKNTARSDSRRVMIGIEEEPGASGKNNTYNYSHKVLLGYAVKGVPPGGASKAMRALPASTASKQGRIKVVEADWNSDFFDELEAFPLEEAAHDDQVDALSGAFNLVSEMPDLQAVPTGVNSSRVPARASYWGGV